MRHHRRTPSAHREIRETLDAVTEFPSEGQGGQSHHRINQYIIKDEIGRGSYGAVHLAVDQFGNEFAVKEFSKVRLRKRAQSSMLRRGPHHPRRFPPGAGLNGRFPEAGPTAGSSREDQQDALVYIREEIAIMKKLNHPNLVQLIEVLDDPEEDSLYMVLEMCRKGVVMKVGLDDSVDPYDCDSCRCWFRDLILGIEYLHAQGVIHRDIKPENLLLTGDDVLKVSDFGVSEMFQKPGDKMMTAKSAGSPAFLPPELCVARHGDVSGPAADIWSMGITLYCLRYGRLPFNHMGVLEMYEAIKNDSVELPTDEEPELVDLFGRILDKDPEKRITMSELREHPWVTRNGEDKLLPAEENCAQIVESPNELEVNRAVTRKMNHLLCVMKAIRRFKAILERHRAGHDGASSTPSRTASDNFDPAKERARAEEIEALVKQRRQFQGYQTKDEAIRNLTLDLSRPEGGLPGGPDADVTELEPLFLGVGAGVEEGHDDFGPPSNPHASAVSESPTNTDFNVYDRAYEEEVDRIMANPSRRPTMYLTRFVKERQQYQAVANVVESMSQSELANVQSPGRFADAVARMMGEAAASKANSAQKPEE
ncbi:calcium/calmodulin-dependent protein kinase [Plectosphaerella plurivora]|uniref:Calcium/calmodulin-dependent protein kinase n=1 Tax=Plectosphaerella plurivora TaxID=936078 RepID=A0A9P8V218_9PEZI|nr:calcium/calmodulin-dependent protein kinase [Plectosphaerella plurivora]